MKALFGLEIKFAALRDRLYVERMEETAAEEEMILNGMFPPDGCRADEKGHIRQSAIYSRT